MDDSTFRSLAWLEYEFLRVDCQIGRLRRKLRRSAGPLPCASLAADRLGRLRRLLRQTLSCLDEALNATRPQP